MITSFTKSIKQIHTTSKPIVNNLEMTAKLLTRRKNMLSIVSKSFQYFPCPSWFYVYDYSDKMITQVAKVYWEYPKIFNNYQSPYGKTLNIKNNEIIKGKVIIPEDTRYKNIDNNLFLFVNNEDTYTFIKMLNGYKLEEIGEENKIHEYEDNMSMKYAERN